MIGPEITLLDFKRIVAAAREMVAAHEKRNPSYEHVTLNERAAYENLMRRIGEAIERRAA